MCLPFHTKVVHFFGMPKKKSMKHLLTFTKTFFLGLPYLGAQIKYAQNWYTAVQVDLTHALRIYQINVPQVTQKANKTCIRQYLLRTVRIET